MCAEGEDLTDSGYITYFTASSLCLWSSSNAIKTTVSTNLSNANLCPLTRLLVSPLSNPMLDNVCLQSFYRLIVMNVTLLTSLSSPTFRLVVIFS